MLLGLKDTKKKSGPLGPLFIDSAKKPLRYIACPSRSQKRFHMPRRKPP